MISSIITEDNEIIRHGLKNALEETKVTKVIGDYASLGEMLPHLKSLKPDVVILGGIGSLAERCLACNDIRELSPDTRILTLTERHQDDELREIILSGAAGCVLTSAGKAEIARSVGIVACGGFSFECHALVRLMERVPKQEPSDKPAALDDLTERERVICPWLAKVAATKKSDNN
ncbi:MAG: response regulator transcription factor [Chloroflexi bacterium]|nr:response regulator transcription factor [Chloroflexota bacterium]